MRSSLALLKTLSACCVLHQRGSEDHGLEAVQSVSSHGPRENRGQRSDVNGQQDADEYPEVFEHPRASSLR